MSTLCGEPGADIDPLADFPCVEDPLTVSRLWEAQAMMTRLIFGDCLRDDHPAAERLELAVNLLSSLKAVPANVSEWTYEQRLGDKIILLPEQGVETAVHIFYSSLAKRQEHLQARAQVKASRQ